MLLIVGFTIMIGIIMGLLSRPPKYSKSIKFNYLPLILLIGILSFLITFIPNTWGLYIFWVQQVSVLIPCWVNREIKSIQLFAIGYIMNGIAILSGGGKMPVSDSTLINDDMVKHTVFTGSPLNYLGDSIPIYLPNFYTVASLGDFIIEIAIVWMVADLIRRIRYQHNNILRRKEENV